MALPGGFVEQVHFNVGGAEDVAGALEFDADFSLVVVQNGVPLPVWQRFELLADGVEELVDQPRVPGEADFEGVFDDQWEQFGGGL